MARIRTKTETGVAAICRVIASTSGFTLLEAIVSPVFVAIAGLGVLMIFGTGQINVQASGTHRIAAQLAQQRIEQVRAGGYGNGGRLPGDPRQDLAWSPIPGNPGFQRTTGDHARGPADAAGAPVTLLRHGRRALGDSRGITVLEIVITALISVLVLSAVGSLYITSRTSRQAFDFGVTQAPILAARARP